MRLAEKANGVPEKVSNSFLTNATRKTSTHSPFHPILRDFSEPAQRPFIPGVTQLPRNCPDLTAQDVRVAGDVAQRVSLAGTMPITLRSSKTRSCSRDGRH